MKTKVTARDGKEYHLNDPALYAVDPEAIERLIEFLVEVREETAETFSRRVYFLCFAIVIELYKMFLQILKRQSIQGCSHGIR